jgi:hypothetical protein
MKNQLAVQWLFEQLTYGKELYDEQGYASPEAMDKLLDQAHKIQEEQIKSAWNDGWKTATFKVCDWSENAYYDKIKPTDCKHGFDTCKNDDMCDTCDEGENYES